MTIKKNIETPLKSSNGSDEKNGKSRLVQMRLLRKTLERIDHLKKMTEIENRTQIVSMAIHLAEIYFQNREEGNKIQIVKNNGDKETINWFGV